MRVPLRGSPAGAARVPGRTASVGVSLGSSCRTQNSSIGHESCAGAHLSRWRQGEEDKEARAVIRGGAHAFACGGDSAAACSRRAGHRLPATAHPASAPGPHRSARQQRWSGGGRHRRIVTTAMRLPLREPIATAPAHSSGARLRPGHGNHPGPCSSRVIAQLDRRPGGPCRPEVEPDRPLVQPTEEHSSPPLAAMTPPGHPGPPVHRGAGPLLPAPPSLHRCQ
jgi:hypothetical protein